MTVAKLSGMADVAVEYMAGHKLDKTTQTYWQTRADTELRDLYAKHYDDLRALKPKVDTEKIKQLETRVIKREDIIDQLVENGKYKDTEIKEMSEQVQQLTERMEGFEAFVNRMRELDEEIQAKKGKEVFKDVIEQDREAREIEKKERPELLEKAS